VLRGHCHRSGAGLYYETAAELEEALTLLLSDTGLRARMGQAGRRYVELYYSWGTVLETMDWAIRQVPETP
jgi:glycosyltransferase involved in cell wall biosynthesis